MNVQYIKDEKQNTIGVFIPIKIWEQMKLQNPDLEKYESIKLDKLTILDNILKSTDDLKEIEKKSKN